MICSNVSFPFICGIAKGKLSERQSLMHWVQIQSWTVTLTNITHPVSVNLSRRSANPQILSLCGCWFSMFRSAGNIPHILPQRWILDQASPVTGSFQSG